MWSGTELSRLRTRALIGAVFFLISLWLGLRVSQATELIPSYGISKPIDGDVSAKSFAGLALRSDLLPLLKTEIAVAYRSESRFDDQLKVRQWPVTASLYLAPTSMLYAGGGVGWYQTTFDYKNDLLFEDETHQDFGVHLGGGFQVPLGPAAALDLSGRYVMMRDQQSRLVPEKFDPDFWVTSLGLAIKF